MSTAPDRLLHLGGTPVGDDTLQAPASFYVYSSSSATPYAYWQKALTRDKLFSTIAGAMAATTDARNDKVYLTPEDHSQASGITWSRNMTHLIGMYPPAYQNQRSRITNSANFNNLVTVSGYGNLIENIYFNYGRAASAVNKTALALSGSRNTFLNCHFLCADAAGVDLATDYFVNISGDENYFKNCFFGNDSIAWTNGRLVYFSAGNGRAVFEDCIFLIDADANTYRFVGYGAGIGNGLSLFKRCTFINIGTAISYGVDGTGLNNHHVCFDHSQFAGCTDIVEAAYENYVWMSNYQTHDTAGTNNIFFTGLMQHPDVS